MRGSERSFGRSLATHMVVGGSASLPDTYGMRASKLADLLNRYRAAALGTSTAPAPDDG